MRKKTGKNKTNVNNGFEALQSLQQQTLNQNSDEGSDCLEFVIKCDGQDFTFSLPIPDGASQETADEFYQIACNAITCPEEEFPQYGVILGEHPNPIIRLIKDSVITRFSEIRLQIAGMDCCQQEAQVQTQHETTNSPSTEKENTMNAQNTNKQGQQDQTADEAQARLEETIAKIVKKIVEETLAAKDKVETAATTATETVKEAAAEATEQATVTKEAVKDAAKKTKTETKGFFARHKKKLLIGGGVLSAAGLGYYGWKRYGSTVFDGAQTVGETVTEAITVASETAAS